MFATTIGVGRLLPRNGCRESRHRSLGRLGHPRTCANVASEHLPTTGAPTLDSATPSLLQHLMDQRDRIGPLAVHHGLVTGRGEKARHRGFDQRRPGLELTLLELRLPDT